MLPVCAVTIATSFSIHIMIICNYNVVNTISFSVFNENNVLEDIDIRQILKSFNTLELQVYDKEVLRDILDNILHEIFLFH